jgi:hypothetical protein
MDNPMRPTRFTALSTTPNVSLLDSAIRGARRGTSTGAFALLAAVAAGCGGAPAHDKESTEHVSAADDSVCDPWWKDSYGLCLRAPAYLSPSATASSVTVHYLPYVYGATTPLPDHVEVSRAGSLVGKI